MGLAEVLEDNRPRLSLQVSYDINYDAINSHVRRRLASAEVSLEPFPHLYLEQLLPEEYYDLLLDALPIPQDLGTDNNGALNFGICTTDPRFALMTPMRQRLWREFEERVNQQEIRSGLIRLFTQHLKRKCDMMLDEGWEARARAFLGADWEKALASGEWFQKEGASGGRILLVTRNFGLRPHVDNATSLFTYLLYFPRDNRREELGTRVHMAVDSEKLCRQYKALKKTNVWFPSQGDLRGEGDFVFPFRRNSLAVMLCVPTSVHSAIFSDINYCRYAYQTQVFIRDDLADALFKGWSAEKGSY